MMPINKKKKTKVGAVFEPCCSTRNFLWTPLKYKDKCYEDHNIIKFSKIFRISQTTRQI